MTAISQLQMSYSAPEDRILLRLNTDDGDEFRFWLTRRFAGLLKQALQAHCAADPDISAQPSEAGRQAVQAFKQEAAASGSNFSDPFRPSSSFPLGEAPVLAYKLTYKVAGDLLRLAIEPRTGQGIRLELNPQLNFNVTRLLRSASETGGWRLDWDAPAPDEARVIN